MPAVANFSFSGEAEAGGGPAPPAVAIPVAKRSVCESVQGGELATINGPEQNAFGANCDLTHAYTGLWIGLTDEGHEGTWTWIDGTPFGHTNWESGQPDGGPGENVAVIKPSHMPNGGGYWHDVSATGWLLPCVLRVCASTPVTTRTWGQLKSMYR